MAIVVTGGCGFIGSNFVRNWLLNSNELIVNVDAATYAADEVNVQFTHDNYRFIKAEIGEADQLKHLFEQIKPRAIIHFAAETHVDNSISQPNNFIHTNVLGTHLLLQASLEYWRRLDEQSHNSFKFINISTDEVYGSLTKLAEPFTERNILQPSNPYSASKAAAEHIARSFWITYGFPVITTRCSNNFGPFQHKEKLIPRTIHALVNKKRIGLYGDGTQIRDWLYVEDHIDAISTILNHGHVGEIYNIGGGREISNKRLVKLICSYFDKINGKKQGWHFDNQVEFIEDRPGHDFRYALNSTKMLTEFRWRAKHDFQQSLNATIDWHIKKSECVNFGGSNCAHDANNRCKFDQFDTSILGQFAKNSADVGSQLKAGHSFTT